MRISKTALIIVVTLLVPVVVELRTALSWFGVEMSVLESIVLAAVFVLAIVVWAVWPPNGDAETEPSGLD